MSKSEKSIFEDYNLTYFNLNFFFLMKIIIRSLNKPNYLKTNFYKLYSDHEL